MISEGSILQTEFEEKKISCKEIPGEKIYCTEKTLVYVVEKSSEVWEKEVLPKPNHP